MDSDVLFRWMSENESGSLRYLRDRICWFFGVTNHPNPRKLAGLWIRDAVARGLLFVDWSADQWRVPGPVLTTIPGRFNLALLTGGRTADLNNRLAVAVERDDLSVRFQDDRTDDFGLGGPAAVFIEYRSIKDLSETSHYLGVTLRYDAFQSLAERLERVRLGELTSSPLRAGTSVERWDSQRMEFEQFSPTSTWPIGLYCETVHGQRRFSINRQGEWYKTDRSPGVYLAANPDDQLIRWRPEHRGASEGTVLVDNGASLPDEQRRVLGMCTGLRPIVQRQSKNTRYDNVPRNIAVKVSASLNQRLTDLEPLIS